MEHSQQHNSCFDPLSGQQLLRLMGVMVDIMEIQACDNERRRGKGTEAKTSAIADDSSKIMEPCFTLQQTRYLHDI